MKLKNASAERPQQDTPFYEPSLFCLSLNALKQKPQRCLEHIRKTSCREQPNQYYLPTRVSTTTFNMNDVEEDRRDRMHRIPGIIRAHEGEIAVSRQRVNEITRRLQQLFTQRDPDQNEIANLQRTLNSETGHLVRLGREKIALEAEMQQLEWEFR